ncbi:MAG: hypothetical protein LBS50_05840 [Prevotellaceae bacterium]|jgi:uncharacterized protein with HEPN domain|nr:hypothetical protein [Prevotellaceae bacterium]
MKDKRTYKMYIDDILTAIERIFEYTLDYDFIHLPENRKQILKIDLK